jgi:hypothetical protein
VNDYVVTGLTNAQFYSAYIEATNNGGLTYGPRTNFMDFQTGSLPPIGPSTVTATAVGVGTANINWTPPQILPDATIFWYYIESRSTNPSDLILSTNGWAFAQSNVLISGLNLSSRYHFNVQAANCPGYSPIVSTNMIVFRGTVTGGAVTQVGGFTIHTFSTVGNTSCIVTNTSITVELLVVAGGSGGGGGDGGGGGGAGGLVYQASYTLAPGTYTVTVGGGGSAGNSSGNAPGGDGGNSVFGPITAFGGGGGAGAGTTTGVSGGSGGGGTHDSGAGAGGTGQQPSRPSPSTGFGNNGGQSFNSSPWSGGGGGGAGQAGANGSGSAGGNGGVGRQYNTSGTPLFYAGGGGGGSAGSGGGTGGSGGGANGGSPNSAGNNGTANTGGGGGGGNNREGGSGGSGIVILRYAT